MSAMIPRFRLQIHGRNAMTINLRRTMTMALALAALALFVVTLDLSVPRHAAALEPTAETRPHSEHGPSSRPGGHALSREQVEAGLQVLADLKPSSAAALRAAKPDDPAVEKLVHEQWNKINRLLGIRKSDEDLYRLNIADILACHRSIDL